MTARFLKRYSLATLTVVLAVTSGCSSIGMRGMANGQARTYPGAKADAGLISDSSESLGLAAFGIFDIVPSAVLDTLLLPFDLIAIRKIAKRNDSPPNKSLEPTAAPLYD